MPAQDRARSGEHLVTAEEARSIAEDAAESLIAQSRLSGEKDNGRRDAMLDNLLSEIRGLRNDIQPVIVTTAQHATLISGIHHRLNELKKSGEETAKAAVEEAAKAAKAAIHAEIAEGVKAAKTSWGSVLPGIIGSLASSLVVGIVAYMLGGGFSDRQQYQSPNTPAAAPAPTKTTP